MIVTRLADCRGCYALHVVPTPHVGPLVWRLLYVEPVVGCYPDVVDLRYVTPRLRCSLIYPVLPVGWLVIPV